MSYYTQQTLCWLMRLRPIVLLCPANIRGVHDLGRFSCYTLQPQGWYKGLGFLLGATGAWGNPDSLKNRPELSCISSALAESRHWPCGIGPYAVYTLQLGCWHKQLRPIPILYLANGELAQVTWAICHIILGNQGVGTRGLGHLAMYTQ